MLIKLHRAILLLLIIIWFPNLSVNVKLQFVYQVINSHKFGLFLSAFLQCSPYILSFL